MSAPGGQALKLGRYEGAFTTSWLLALTVCWTRIIWALWHLPLFFLLAVVVLHAAANAAGELISIPIVRTAETVVMLTMAVVAVAVLVRRAPAVTDRMLGVGGMDPRTERR